MNPEPDNQALQNGRKLRVLMLSDYGYLAGGAEILLHSLAKELRQCGHTVRIFASTAGRRQDQNNTAFADDWCYGSTTPVRAIVQTANPWAARRLRNTLKEFSPDIVHVHMFLTQLSPLILNEVRTWPAIYTAHWFRAICMTGFKMLPDGSPCQQPPGIACLKNRCVPLRDWLPLAAQMKSLQRKKGYFTRVVAGSDTIRSRLESENFPVDRTILYGIRELPQRPALQSPPRIGFAARLVAEKGGAVLLQAFEQVIKAIPEAILDVFGEGPELLALKRQAARLGIDHALCFHGYLVQDELQPLLGRVWVQAAPTLFEEPGGIVGYEAAMRGTALVASDRGGFIDSVIPGKTGYLTPPGDSKALASALIVLLSDMERADEFGRAGRLLAKQSFSLSKMTDQYLALYHELLGQGDP